MFRTFVLRYKTRADVEIVTIVLYHQKRDIARWGGTGSSGGRRAIS